jgi:hypothetical protein
VNPELSKLEFTTKQQPEEPFKLFFLANSVQSLNLSSDWFPHSKREDSGKPSAQTLIIQTISKFEGLSEFIYSNNAIKKSAGAAQFFEALQSSGKHL